MIFWFIWYFSIGSNSFSAACWLNGWYFHFIDKLFEQYEKFSIWETLFATRFSFKNYRVLIPFFHYSMLIFRVFWLETSAFLRSSLSSWILIAGPLLLAFKPVRKRVLFFGNWRIVRHDENDLKTNDTVIRNKISQLLQMNGFSLFHFRLWIMKCGKKFKMSLFTL